VWKVRVGLDGRADLAQYGSVPVAGLTVEDAKVAINKHVAELNAHHGEPTDRSTTIAYLVKPSDTLVWSVDFPGDPARPPVGGRSRVNTDGSADLGQYGIVSVAGLPIAQARAAIARQVAGVIARPVPQKPGVPDGPPVPVTTIEWGHSTPETTGRLIPVPASLASGVSSRTEEPPSEFEPPSASSSAELKPVEFQEPSAPKPQTGAPPARQAPTHVGPVEPAGTGAAQELAKVSLPPYVIEPPDILLIESTQSPPDQPIRGQHLVRPDGTVGLGIYGSVPVAGLTLEQAKMVIGDLISQRVPDLDLRNLYVDVLGYNSKFYYVVTDGGGYGEQVYRFPITGSDTVLDAISQIQGLPPVASKKRIWVARPVAPNCGGGWQTLPVDWIAITQCGQTATNYQVMPGDRIYVEANPWITFDSAVAKFISPFERMFGITLLGSETTNSIRFPRSNSLTGR
jgi:polysaccharide export outer membrane protein